MLPLNSVGIVTARDHLTIHWTAQEVLSTVKDFVETPPEEARKKYQLGKDVRDWKVSLAQEDIRAHGVKEDLVAPVLYRPFDRRYTYYTGRTRGFICMPRPEVMRHMLAGVNLGLITTRMTRDPWNCLVARLICGHKSMAGYDINSLFPLYLYPNAEGGPNKQAGMAGLSPWPEGKDGRRPNLSPGFVAELERRLALAFVPDGGGDLEKTFGPEDVFHYIYAVFHSSTYRERYAEFLKMDFPRVPFTSDMDLFCALAHKGAELVALHLLESPVLRQRITRYPIPGDNMVEPGHPRYLAPGEPEPGTGKPLTLGRVYISKDNPKTGKRGQYIEGVPPDVWRFQVGGYQVCDKWLKDRRGLTLTNADLDHYECVVVALKDTIRLMAEIDQLIEQHGGWPLS